MNQTITVDDFLRTATGRTRSKKLDKWTPQIRELLGKGATARAIQQYLEVNGCKANYSTVCSYIARMNGKKRTRKAKKEA